MGIASLEKEFIGQKLVILSKPTIKNLRENEISKKFYVSNLGHYPVANNHYRSRKNDTNQYIFIYCTKGKGKITISNKVHSIQSNQFFIIPKNIKHEYKADDLSPWSIYWFEFNGIIAPELYNRYKKTKYVNTPYSADRIQRFQKVFNLFNEYNQEDLLEYANLLSLNFISSFVYNDSDTKYFTSNEETLIDSIKNFLLNNLERNYCLDELATKFNYSKSHLQAKFKIETGYPLHAFFNLQKILKACEYLNSTNLRIKEISYKLGFEDPLYFSRIFKNLMGMSPSTYKKTI